MNIKPIFALIFCGGLVACQSAPTPNKPTTTSPTMSINSNSPTAPEGFHTPKTPYPSTHNDVKLPQSPTYRTPSGTIINPQPPTPQAVQATPIPDELKKVWRLAQITGTDDDTKLNQSLGEHTVTIDLTHAPKGSAFAGCNQMNFVVRLNGDRFGFGNVTSTRKLCFDVMGLEFALAKNVRATRHYAFDGESLVLYGQTVKMHLVPHTP